MKIDKNLYTCTFEELKSNFSLYKKAVDILTKAENRSPEGACCGKNKDRIIKKFLDNRETYLDAVSAVENRTIQPLWSGARHFSTAQRQINGDLLTDEESIFLINHKLVDKRFFDLTNYTGDEIKEEEVVEEPVKKRTRKTKNIEE